MIRSMIGLTLLFVAGLFCGQAYAAGAGGNRVGNAVSTFLIGNSRFPQGTAGGTAAFLEGHITDGFDRNTNGFKGLVIVLTEDTGLAPLGTTMAASFDKFYNALLPLYMALDGPATKLAAPALPITRPLGAAIVTYSGIFASVLNRGGGTLPGLSGMK